MFVARGGSAVPFRAAPACSRYQAALSLFSTGGELNSSGKIRSPRWCTAWAAALSRLAASCPHQTRRHASDASTSSETPLIRLSHQSRGGYPGGGAVFCFNDEVI